MPRMILRLPDLFLEIARDWVLSGLLALKCGTAFNLFYLGPDRLWVDYRA